MTGHFLLSPVAGERWRAGPLTPHVDVFGKRLQGLGYARSTRRDND